MKVRGEPRIRDFCVQLLDSRYRGSKVSLCVKKLSLKSDSDFFAQGTLQLTRTTGQTRRTTMSTNRSQRRLLNRLEQRVTLSPPSLSPSSSTTARLVGTRIGIATEEADEKPFTKYREYSSSNDDDDDDDEDTPSGRYHSEDTSSKPYYSKQDDEEEEDDRRGYDRQKTEESSDYKYRPKYFEKDFDEDFETSYRKEAPKQSKYHFFGVRFTIAG